MPNIDTAIEARPPIRRAHFRDSANLIYLERNEWDEFIHPNGSLYWACSTGGIRLVSDIEPPLSNMRNGTLSIISHELDVIDQIFEADDYPKWEIYTDGLSCVYIHHESRSASENVQSLGEFKTQIEGLQGNSDIVTSAHSLLFIFNGG